MNNELFVKISQELRETRNALNDTLEMNRKLGSENLKLEKEIEQLKKDIIEIEKLSDSRWEENQRLRAELQIKYLGCHS
jgi:hypothetical protein